ncbi:MAG: cytochrome c [Archangium sp.]|nr:cytochrome c [Archangium sp.]MDP3573952.1 cytochrome c [Archangium sp.]
MKKLVLVAGLISMPAFAADAAFDLKGDAAKGEAHYKTLCISCHGEKGDGNGPAGAAMNPKPGNFTDPANAERITGEWVYKMVKNGGAANGKSPMMVAWSGALNDQQVRDVSAYVLKFKPAAAPVKAEPAKAAPVKAAPKKK